MTDDYIKELAKAEWEADPTLKEEFDNDFQIYLAWRQADAKGLIKTLNH